MQERFQNFTVLIMKINRYVHKIKAAETAELGLKGPHVSCLYYLYREGGLTAKQLCDICEEDKAAVSRSIDYLEKNGFICCDSVAQKRYRAILKLTAQGEAAGRRIAEKIDDVLELASEGLDGAERKSLYKALSLICGNLQKITK